MPPTSRQPGTTTTLVSGTDAKGADGVVKSATLAADGSRVFFSSTATDLDPAVTVAGEQVWTRATTGAPTLVTRGADVTHGADKPSSVIDASADGAFVLISSAATDLTAPLKHHDGTPMLYRVASVSFEAEPLSARGDDTADKTPTAGRGAISADGDVVAYATGATNLLDGFIDGNGDGDDVTPGWSGPPPSATRSGRRRRSSRPRTSRSTARARSSSPTTRARTKARPA